LDYPRARTKNKKASTPSRYPAAVRLILEALEVSKEHQKRERSGRFASRFEGSLPSPGIH